MKPDWDKLAEEFADSQKVVIADVDCTASGKALCEKYGVQGCERRPASEALSLLRCRHTDRSCCVEQTPPSRPSRGPTTSRARSTRAAATWRR